MNNMFNNSQAQQKGLLVGGGLSDFFRRASSAVGEKLSSPPLNEWILFWLLLKDVLQTGAQHKIEHG